MEKLTGTLDVGVAFKARWTEAAVGIRKILTESATSTNGALTRVVVMTCHTRITLIPRRAATLITTFDVMANGAKSTRLAIRTLVNIYTL